MFPDIALFANPGHSFVNQRGKTSAFFEKDFEEMSVSQL